VEIELEGADGAEIIPVGDEVGPLGERDSARFYSAMEIPGAVIAAGNDGVRHWLAVGDNSDAAFAKVQQARADWRQWRRDREERIAGLLNGPRYLDSDDPELTLALRWLNVTMDQLVTRQRGDGIYAGLPWFNEYWGRDSFIAIDKVN
jgi:hypothetical protein